MITEEKLEEKLCEHLYGRIQEADVAHDFGHLKRVLNMALAISEAEQQVNRLVIIAASLLHDYIALPKNHPERHMASRMSAERAIPLLKNMNFPEELLPETINAIEAHSYSANLKPTCFEACIDKDADRLDALGARSEQRRAGKELRSRWWPHH